MEITRGGGFLLPSNYYPTDKKDNPLSPPPLTLTQRSTGPYSHFRVGAAILTESGSVITGVNVENASFPVGTCAERCAAARAVVSFYICFFLWR